MLLYKELNIINKYKMLLYKELNIINKYNILLYKELNIINKYKVLLYKELNMKRTVYCVTKCICLLHKCLRYIVSLHW